MSNSIHPKFRQYNLKGEGEEHAGPLARSIKGWGREDWLLNNEKLCFKVLTLLKDHRCSLHFHIKKEELFFIAKGSLMFVWTEVATGAEHSLELFTGDSVHIPPGLPHQFAGTSEEPCVFVECSTQHFEDDSYRVRGGDSQK